MPVSTGVCARRLTKFLFEREERRGTCGKADRLNDRPPARAFALLIGRSGQEPAAFPRLPAFYWAGSFAPASLEPPACLPPPRSRSIKWAMYSGERVLRAI